ncbi:hypothetical protein [Pseudoxanthomonas winnipegensis]|uniref:hypothetical protein n=1 Tax=Pseudoxanthomonas winnipegensis TaxID=2480810 RepID=UPI00102D98D9|nr:hypothetical protein [Pseudoxanthomonas winnipegensis]RZZ89628.1 hypothetical protein EA662_04475 [Pseudoxanthomonas winnipegensis]TBV78586.1 hypothetical protein EYC46_01455 [Pseudoxanthomonas winnipegensis]
MDVSHNASKPPEPREVYAPKGHEGALDPDRAIVVGNRGVGKSFWSGALTEDKTRELLDLAYPKLKLASVRASLGFSGEDFSTEVCPSSRILASLLKKGAAPEDIWRVVFIKALNPKWRALSFSDAVERIESDPEGYEASMLSADKALREAKIKHVIVFDALDRLGESWQTVRELTRGLLRLALSLRSYSSIRAKIFIRPDQGDDNLIFDFPDASKLRAERVELKWSTNDLYGLMYSWLLNSPDSAVAFAEVLEAKKIPARKERGVLVIPDELKVDESLQAGLFSFMAGEYMGSDHRRGRTYTWLPNHLGDAHGQTAPRTFLTALKFAADKGVHDLATARKQAVDYHGIKEGVQKASQVRLDQLAEDHIWIKDVLGALPGMEVPCPEQAIIAKWKAGGVVRKIRKDVEAGKYLGPLELQSGAAEPALLDALTRLGITERRSSGKINIPDIFRVAASIKRRGGVKPPSK